MRIAYLGGKAGAGAALALLLAINLFNYIDRQVLAAVEPEIRDTFFPPNDPNAMATTGRQGNRNAGVIVEANASHSRINRCEQSSWRDGRCPIQFNGRHGGRPSNQDRVSEP